ncbi:MAG: porin family protein [Saprospiraceae bacterium]
MRDLLLILIFSMTTTIAFGQFGVKAGVNFSNITTDDDDVEDLEAKIGFQAGAMIKIKLSESFAIQPEALFVRKGSKYKYLGADVTSNLDYVDIPVLIVLKPFDIPLQIQFGPQFSYLLGTNVKYENALFGIDNTYEAEREDFEDYDLGYAVGLGLNFGNTVLDLRFTQGFKEYEKETTIGNVTIEPSSKHFNLQASLGFFF